MSTLSRDLCEAALNDALRAMYEAFAWRSLRPGFAARCSPVGDRQQIAAAIEACPLAELPTRPLALYCSSAITTMGEVEDFLYFTPRMLELYATADEWHDHFHLLLEKLVSQGIPAASPRERQAVQRVINCLWPRALSDEDGPITPLVHARNLCDAGIDFVGRELAEFEPSMTSAELHAVVELVSSVSSFPAQVQPGIVEWIRARDIRGFLRRALETPPPRSRMDGDDVAFALEDVDRLLSAASA